MKRICMIMAVMLAAAFAMSAQESTKTYKFGEIKSIDAGYSYKVYVTEGASREVTVVYDKELEDYMIVNYSPMGSELVLRMDDLPRRLRSGNFSSIKVYVSMNEIDDIELSGAASVSFEGQYRASELEIDLSGAASLNGLVVTANTLSADCSGAASFNIEGAFKGDVEMELSGAVKGRFRGKGRNFDAELSGACNLDAGLDFKNCNLDCSGASKAELAGKVERLSVEGSGACSIDAKDLEAEYASVDLSGASKAKVNAEKELRYDIPRSCKITYYGDAKLINLSEESNVVRGN
jgi:hypothetical protein